MSLRHLSLATTLAAGCALAGACAAEAEAPGGAEPVCTAQDECAAGLVCSFNHCIVPEPNRITLAARIIPPPTSGLLTQQLPELRLEDGPDRLVKLLAPTVVRGTVRPPDDPLVTNLEGELEVRTDGDIPGLDYTFSAHSLEGLDVNGNGYTLSLLPGRSYKGTFRPTDRTLPRHVFPLESNDIARGRFDITLPARGEYLKVEGRVMKRDYTAIVGARVVVLSATREVAAVTTSDSPRGRFEVLVPPSVGSFSIKTESPDEGPVFPEFTTEPYTYAAGTTIDVVVPDLPPGTEPLDAVIRVTTLTGDNDPAGIVPATMPAVGRTVTIVGVLAGGTLRRTGTTNDAGEVTFKALPGAYECLVASPPQSRAATWHGFINLARWTQDEGAGADVVQIDLQARVPFVGRITDAFGLPVEAGTLTLERRHDAAEGESLVIAPAPFEAELGLDGLFVTAVDPGVYDVLVAPDPETGAPHTFETGLAVGPEGLRFDLGLPPPGLLHLTVEGPDGTWIPQTQVELWIDDDVGEPRLLAVGSTNERGYVDLIVPHLGDVSTLTDLFSPNGPP